MNQLQYTREDIGILSKNLKPLSQMGVIPEESIASMVDVLRSNLSGTAKPSQSLTVKESCKRLKISKPTLYQLIKRGRIKPIKLMKCTRVLESEIEKILRGEV
ncbi:MAG TPA: hypothetical protein DD381_02130 [Lentisphaeria bacterium]|nr:MAG: hypothetical protein A2X47_08905 [Lentisphaerae bacterium GWF2_38_69]HBM15134.1 hypothetical protein [Lentisphaeria bacterium]